MSLALFSTLLAAVFGLAIGSFLNVVVYRVPNGMSVSHPASACPNCHSEIRAYDNVPVLSWFVLRGKCRDCRTPISGRYPIVEAATGAFFLIVAIRFWPAAGLPSDGLHVASRLLELAAFLYLAAISLALGIIDAEHHRLPNRIVLPSYAVAIAMLGAADVLTGDFGGLLRTLIGGAALFVFYFGIAFVYPAGMGFGDIKLAGVLGLYLGFLGWGPLIVGAFAAFLVGGVFAIVLIALKRVGRKGGIPFGPWMLVGAWIGVFAGQAVFHGYLTAIGAA
ncbi:prepilin peptidase [Frondihabitans australicus]|uniref:Leader peptidase (Prepilin peptidase)/N-methyltransferase n=1 Tax=Frondihabitans australicus TaxID=386892 RepID=A0A495IHT8_9MICO|nr:A24 family peptidase [Frondihabitans australicus]RKR75524.1 leader peptidase (prepilin peptidase)/N-methyltransferase [Frondihabitans australicus]